MGKNLKGKKLGKGLSQRQDGRYSARFVKKNGERIEKYFNSLAEAKNWLSDARNNDAEHTVLAPFDSAADEVLNDDGTLPAFSEMTVNQWFDFLYKNIIPHLSWNTKRDYSDRYNTN